MCFFQRQKKATDAKRSSKIEPASDKASKNIFFVLGGPGSGKGTQCAKLVEEFKVAHISVGDLLRDEVASKSEIGQSIDQMMKEGKIVPLETVLKVLNKALEKHSASGSILIDGFPREMQQATEFEKNVCKVKAVFYFECTEELMEKRLLKRGETSGRADDNAETIKKRFKTFQEQSLPVIDYFEKQGRLIKISSEPAPTEVYAVVKENYLRLTTQ